LLLARCSPLLTGRKIAMAEFEQHERCLVCELPTNEMHMGFNCCRACSVFYKRTVSRAEALRCKGGNGECILKNPETTCRKCRYERFSSVLAACTEGKPTECSMTEQAGVSMDNHFLDHETSLQSDVSTIETPTLERMKQAYRVLCLIRKNGEMGTCSTETFDQLQRGTIKYANATYKNVVPNARIMYTGLMEFFASVFDDFRNLSKDNQNLLVYSNFDIMYKTDDLYRSVNHFPDDDTLMPGYTTIFSIYRVDAFLIDCPPEVNKEEASAELIKNTRRNLLTNKAHFKRVQLTSDEFVALLGLALWREQASIVDENINEIIKTNRVTILAELHRHYAIRGRTDYAARLGELLCLLVNMEELAAQHKEDEKVYQLMNMFNEYSP
ncbi:hypothetical protein PMAYCL1PPCAC_15323, partial [Pristionchus mayeri]